MYVFATYPTSTTSSREEPTSSSIIWDTIIPAPESPYSVNKLKERFGLAKKPKRGLSKKNQGAKGSKKDNSEPGILHLRNQRPKYQIGDITGKMAERENVSLSVGWNVQPWVGALWWSPGSGTVPRTEGGVGVTEGVRMPELKGSKPPASG